MSESLNIQIPDQGIAGIYSWRGAYLCTAEPYSENIPLAPGKKRSFIFEYTR